MSELSIALRTAGSGSPRPTAAKDDTKAIITLSIWCRSRRSKGRGAPVRERRRSGDDGKKRSLEGTPDPSWFRDPDYCRKDAPSCHVPRINAWLRALGMAFAMAWEILWPLILGFALSGVVQAVVSKNEMTRLLPDDGPRSIVTALALGAASSSCCSAGN